MGATYALLEYDVYVVDDKPGVMALLGRSLIEGAESTTPIAAAATSTMVVRVSQARAQPAHRIRDHRCAPNAPPNKDEPKDSKNTPGFPGHIAYSCR